MNILSRCSQKIQLNAEALTTKTTMEALHSGQRCMERAAIKSSNRRDLKLCTPFSYNYFIIIYKQSVRSDYYIIYLP